MEGMLYHRVVNRDNDIETGQFAPQDSFSFRQSLLRHRIAFALFGLSVFVLGYLSLTLKKGTTVMNENDTPLSQVPDLNPSQCPHPWYVKPGLLQPFPQLSDEAQAAISLPCAPDSSKDVFDFKPYTKPQKNGKLDLPAMLQAYEKQQNRMMGVNTCARDRKFYVISKPHSGVGNQAFAYLGLVLKAMYLGRGILIDADNRLFEAFDFPFPASLEVAPEPYRSLGMALQEKNKNNLIGWMSHYSMCNFDLMKMDENTEASKEMYILPPGKSPVTDGPTLPGAIRWSTLKPGLMTPNAYEPGYVSDPIINHNIITAHRGIGWLFPWYYLTAPNTDEGFQIFMINFFESDPDPLGMLLRWLLKPKKVYRDETVKRQEQMNIPQASPDIGIHIRFHSKDEYFFPSRNSDNIFLFYQSAVKLIFTAACTPTSLVSKDKIYTVFLATDQPHMFEMVERHLREFMKAELSKNPDCPANQLDRVRLFEHTIAERKGDGDFMNSMVDLLTLSRSKFVLGTGLSTFSGLATVLSPFPSHFACMVDVYGICRMTTTLPAWQCSKDSFTTEVYYAGFLYFYPEQLETGVFRPAKAASSAGMDVSEVAISPNSYMYRHQDLPILKLPANTRSNPRISAFEENERKARRQTLQEAVYDKEETFSYFFYTWHKYSEYMSKMWFERDNFANLGFFSTI